MKFKYKGVTEAIVVILGQTVQPDEVVDVPEELAYRFEDDPQYENVGKAPVKPVKPGKGDK